MKCLVPYVNYNMMFQFNNIKIISISASNFSTSSILRKVILKNAKGKSKSSQDWLARQLSDPFIDKSKKMQYRCRSAFKLLEINERYGILAAGHYVVDCGASPGSWAQVAVTSTNSDAKDSSKPIGTVVGIDRLPIYPLDGAIFLSKMDFTQQRSIDKLKEIFDGREVDVVLSDMAPNSTGVRELDHDIIIQLAYSVLRFAITVSKKDGTCLVKIWDGSDTPILQKDMEKFYNSVKFVKPRASRGDSAEIYLLAKGFKGLKT